MSSLFNNSDDESNDYKKYYDFPEYYGEIEWNNDDVKETAYVYHFSLWNFLQCSYEDTPSKLVLNVGRHNEYIVFAKDQVYIVTRKTLNDKFFYRCNQPSDKVFLFKGYNDAERYWEFEVINDLDTRGFLDFENLEPNLISQPPKEVIEKFSFIETYTKKSFFGPKTSLMISSRLLDKKNRYFIYKPLRLPFIAFREAKPQLAKPQAKPLSRINIK